MKSAKPIDKDIKAFIEQVAKRMSSLRKKKGYKNHEIFAYEHDIPRAQYGRYEKGQDMQLSSLKKVLKGLGVSPKEFFSDGFE